MRKTIRTLLTFAFYFLCSDALKAANEDSELDRIEPISIERLIRSNLLMPVEDHLIAQLWVDVAVSCHNRVQLFMDHTEDRLSLTKEAIGYLKANGKLGAYAPLLGFKADDFPFKIRLDMRDLYSKQLEHDVGVYNDVHIQIHALLESLSKVHAPLKRPLFMETAKIIIENLLASFDDRNKMLLNHLGNYDKNKLSLKQSDGCIFQDFICTGEWKADLSPEMLLGWEYQARHMETRWAVVKMLWDFLGKSELGIIASENAIAPDKFAIINAFDNLSYLEGLQPEPNLESVEMNTPRNKILSEGLLMGLIADYKDRIEYRHSLRKMFAKSAARNAAKKERMLQSDDAASVPLQSLDDLMAFIGSDEVVEQAQPEKKEPKRKPRANRNALAKQSNLKAQIKAPNASKKKAALQKLVDEVAAAAIAPIKEEEVKVDSKKLSPDQQRRRGEREERRRKNEEEVGSSVQKRGFVLGEKGAAKKSKEDREKSGALRAVEIDSYKAQIGEELDVGLPPLNPKVAEFFHRFYTESIPVCWWEFCSNFQVLGGIITNKSGSARIIGWQDPTVSGAALSKEIHEPHPYYLLGNHYRLHIARFLNVVRAFRHERMKKCLGMEDGRVFDRRTFDEDLGRFWH